LRERKKIRDLSSLWTKTSMPHRGTEYKLSLQSLFFFFAVSKDYVCKINQLDRREFLDGKKFLCKRNVPSSPLTEKIEV
jgi:hypothetical protein